MDISMHFLIRKCRKDPLIFFRIFKLCREVKPDIIHSWGAMPSIYSFPIASILGIKFINAMIRNAPRKIKIFSKLWIISKITFPFSDISRSLLLLLVVLSAGKSDVSKPQGEVFLLACRLFWLPISFIFESRARLHANGWNFVWGIGDRADMAKEKPKIQVGLRPPPPEPTEIAAWINSGSDTRTSECLNVQHLNIRKLSSERGTVDSLNGLRFTLSLICTLAFLGFVLNEA